MRSKPLLPRLTARAPWLVGRNPRQTLARVVLVALAAYLVFGHLLRPVRGQGISMTPTIRSGELLFVNTLAYRVRAPRRGDVVAIRLAGPSVLYVKRLVALPGDRLGFEAGRLIVDGVPQDEPYVRERAPWQLPARTLGPDEFFVVGDNRGMVMSAHDLGTVSRARLVGPVVGY